MKTYARDFSMGSNSLTTDNQRFREVVCNRQEKFRATVEYHEAKEEALVALKKLEGLLPGEHQAFGKLEDIFFHIECICYGAAYKDGMSDLMTAMTFNELGLTKVEYCGILVEGD
ncbi:hypothetical protein [Desulfosporosinus sp.]|uniref:hypothetical protein n=1 Tax=Desulfosporosinus sp. TaxID=157907 RepID=UPI002615FAF9|nr:hypothetical protein [Desulfosporosinus sp.]